MPNAPHPTANDDNVANKAALGALRRALYDYEPATLRAALENLFTANAPVHLGYPLETLEGPGELYEKGYAPLASALGDLERRDTIVMAGTTKEDRSWVGCCGYYTGTFVRPWLDIPPTGHQIAMRFHEFYNFEDGRMVQMQALWDIVEVMMQAGVWPMAPSLGREWHVPAPATLDGLCLDQADAAQSQRSLQVVSQMLTALGRYARGGAAAMELERYWHPRCNWYGPAGIGTCRGIAGFRHWHQIPFLNAMPDRHTLPGVGNLFAQGAYVGFTAWPGMGATISADGWLGIAPANQKITLRSLDFWRCENDLVRENWVLVDLLDVYRQIGVDVFARMGEFNKARRWERAVV